jgi:hypothetical protein
MTMAYSWRIDVAPAAAVPRIIHTFSAVYPRKKLFILAVADGGEEGVWTQPPPCLSHLRSRSSRVRSRSSCVLSRSAWA